MRSARGAFSLAAILLGAGPVSAQSQSHTSVWLFDAQAKCAVFYPDADAADFVTWSGDCVNQKASGQGTATFMSRNRFVAQISGSFAGGAASGSVRMNWADGAHFEGEAKAGQFDGQGSFTRSNGEHYQGEWKNGRANGHGVLTRKDGSKFDGEFLNGEPKPAADAVVSNAPTAPTAQQATASAAGLLTVAAGTDSKDSNANANDTTAKWLDAVSGQKLVAVDGATLTISAVEGSLSLAMLNGNGADQTANLTFLNGKQGTVGDPASPGQVLGLFQVSDAGLDIEYPDGRSEFFGPNPAGGLSMTVQTGGLALCTAWYPQTHTFSTAEREAALASYAKRVGLKAPIGRHSLQMVCASDAPSAGAPATLTAQSPNSTQPTEATDTNKPQPGKSASAADTSHLVIVRASQVHPIDADANAVTSESSADRGSRCLSVEANGASWGFRNGCEFPVQFAYCVMGGKDERISCDGGATAGAIGAHSFDVLFEETSLSAEHDLRWIACQGGAGNVVARLVRADPPTGRCVRGNAF